MQRPVRLVVVVTFMLYVRDNSDRERSELDDTLWRNCLLDSRLIAGLVAGRPFGRHLQAQRRAAGDIPEMDTHRDLSFVD